MGIIEWMPSGVHEGIVSSFTKSFYLTIPQLPTALAARMLATFGQDINGFRSRYEGSTKQADLLFIFN